MAPRSAVDRSPVFVLLYARYPYQSYDIYTGTGIRETFATIFTSQQARFTASDCQRSAGDA